MLLVEKELSFRRQLRGNGKNPDNRARSGYRVGAAKNEAVSTPWAQSATFVGGMIDAYRATGLVANAGAPITPIRPAGITRGSGGAW